MLPNFGHELMKINMIIGRHQLYPLLSPPPTPKYYQQHSRTEQVLRRRGARLVRLRGDQTVEIRSILLVGDIISHFVVVR